jgi:hypothetical protein
MAKIRVGRVDVEVTEVNPNGVLSGSRDDLSVLRVEGQKDRFYRCLEGTTWQPLDEIMLSVTPATISHYFSGRAGR